MNKTYTENLKCRFIDWVNFPIRKDIIYWINEGINIIGTMHDNPELLEECQSERQNSQN